VSFIGQRGLGRDITALAHDDHHGVYQARTQLPTTELWSSVSRSPRLRFLEMTEPCAFTTYCAVEALPMYCLAFLHFLAVAQLDKSRSFSVSSVDTASARVPISRASSCLQLNPYPSQHLPDLFERLARERRRDGSGDIEDYSIAVMWWYAGGGHLGI
jgi:hypothetical protein